MLNKILVGIDLSEANKSAFDTALCLAQANKAKLILLQIIAPKQTHESDESLNSIYEESWQKLKQRGLEAMQTLAKEATQAGVKAKFTQDFGNPGRAICDFAQTQSVDLILVGSRRLTGVKEMFLGSVSNYVTHHAPCSVLIVHQTAEEQN